MAAGILFWIYPEEKGPVHGRPLSDALRENSIIHKSANSDGILNALGESATDCNYCMNTLNYPEHFYRHTSLTNVQTERKAP